MDGEPADEFQAASTAEQQLDGHITQQRLLNGQDLTLMDLERAEALSDMSMPAAVVKLLQQLAESPDDDPPASTATASTTPVRASCGHHGPAADMLSGAAWTAPVTVDLTAWPSIGGDTAGDAVSNSAPTPLREIKHSLLFGRADRDLDRLLASASKAEQPGTASTTAVTPVRELQRRAIAFPPLQAGLTPAAKRSTGSSSSADSDSSKRARAVPEAQLQEHTPRA
jgi:hypothetical protein